MRSILFTILCLLFLSPLSGKNYYVSPRGEDENQGSFKYPKASIQEALKLLNPGDTLFLRGGVYSITESVRIGLNGNDKQWIVISNYPGEKSYIDASGSESIIFDSKKNKFSIKGSVNIIESSFVKLIGIHVSNSHNVGFLIQEPNTSHIELVNCTSEKSYSSGIAILYADSVCIKGCEISGANDIQFRPQGAPIEKRAPNDAMTVSGSKYYIIENNFIHHCLQGGLVCRETCTQGIIAGNRIHDIQDNGLVLSGWYGVMEFVNVYSNEIHDCDLGFVIDASGDNSSLRSIRFHHNIVYDNRGSGIFFSPVGHNGLRTGIYVYNNTVVANGSADHRNGATGGIDLRSTNLSDIFIVNNISYSNYAFEIATFNNFLKGIDPLLRFNIVIDHNLTGEMKSIEEKKGSMPKIYQYLGENYLVADPKFINMKGHDYQLMSDSPAINAAKTDFEFATGNNMGAYSDGFIAN